MKSDARPGFSWVSQLQQLWFMAILSISRANALVPPTPLGEGLKPGMVHVGVGQLATWCDPALASRFPTLSFE